MTAQEKDRIECAIRHIESSLDVDPWAAEIAVEAMERQIAKHSNESSLTQKALDTISRQDAIRWVKTECNPYGKPTIDFESGKRVIEHLKRMSSAQPIQPNTSNTLKSLDCIDRQEAIDALKKNRSIYCDNTPESFRCLSHDEKSRVDEIDACIAELVNLPSAQPEVLACGEGVLNAQPEIIYCKDCIHVIRRLRGGYWCKGKAVTSNHYCGYAERRPDGVDR